MTETDYAYFVFAFPDNDLIHEGTSAVEALAAVYGETRPTQIVLRIGNTLRGHTENELGWDAQAEKAVGDPTWYWPQAGDAGVYLRQVAGT